MAVSNTSILIKRSSVTTNPGTLKAGELAYSYISNTLYFGTVGGNGSFNIGGQYYTSTVDAATNANTASTLVKRDVNGAFQGNLIGSSSNTYALINSQNFSITGGDISASAVGFNGTGAVALNASLNSVSGLSAGYYGGSSTGTSTIPVIQVAANGRIMAISNTTSTSSLTISDGANSNTIYSGTTLYIEGANGITTVVSGNTAKVYTDNTVLRANVTSAGKQVISTDLTVAGNLIVAGSQTYINTSSFQTGTSLIELAANNYIGDVVDIGFYGMSNVAASNVYHGLIREGSGGSNSGSFYLFKNLATAPTGNTVNYAGLTKATLYADLTGSTGLPVSTGISGLGTGVATFLASPTSTNLLAAVVSGNTGTGNLVFNNTPTFVTPNLDVANASQYNIGTLTYSATNAFNKFQLNQNNYVQSVIQNSNTGTQASADYIVSTAYSADNNLYGDFGMNGPGFTGSGAFFGANNVYLTSTGADLAIGTTSANAIHFVVNNGTVDAMTIASNGFVSLQTALTVPYGGTGATSLSAGGIVIGNGTGALSTLANTSFVATGSGSQNNTVTSVTVDSYGRTTALTYQAISGLTVGQGGTGVGTFTSNGLVFGNGTGALQVTSAAGTSDQTWSNQIMTVNNSGVPVWSTVLDGGTF